MFSCGRCGSSYSARHLGVEDCPRCRLRDGVEAPLAFKAFDLSGLEPAPALAAAPATNAAAAATPTSVT